MDRAVDGGEGQPGPELGPGGSYPPSFIDFCGRLVEIHRLNLSFLGFSGCHRSDRLVCRLPLYTISSDR